MPSIHQGQVNCEIVIGVNDADKLKEILAHFVSVYVGARRDRDKYLYSYIVSQEQTPQPADSSSPGIWLIDSVPQLSTSCQHSRAKYCFPGESFIPGTITDSRYPGA